MSAQTDGRGPPDNKLGLEIAYFLGLPLLVALIAGWNQAFLGASADRLFSIGFWIGLQLLIWCGAYVSSYSVYRLLARWRPPLWLILTAGILVGWILLLPIIAPYLVWGIEMAGAPPLAPVPVGFTWSFAAAILNGLVPGAIFWIATNYFFDQVLGLPRFRYAPRHSDEADDVSVKDLPVRATPPLIQRLPSNVRAPVVYLKAEDHFVRVMTTSGDHLVYSRLKDATNELAGVPGLRVHRSYWVARSAVDSLERRGHNHVLRLRNGEEIPVSRSFLNDVRRVLISDEKLE